MRDRLARPSPLQGEPAEIRVGALAFKQSMPSATLFQSDLGTSRAGAGSVRGTEHRLVAVTDPSGAVSRTEYDPEGLVLARVDAKQRRTEYEYDLAGRLVKVTDPPGNVTETGYCADQGGQACAVVDPAGNLVLKG